LLNSVHPTCRDCSPGTEHPQFCRLHFRWASKLRDNQEWILWAASRAEKAADYILGIVSEEPVPANSSEEVILEPAIAE